MPVPTHSFMRSRLRDHPDEGPGHPVVEAVGVLELPVVVGEGLRALAAEGLARGRRRPAGRSRSRRRCPRR